MLACILLSVLCFVTTAHAGTLYRCVGGSGEVVFSNDATGYHGCRKLGSYGATTSRREPKASLARVTGGVDSAPGQRSPATDGVASLAAVQGAAMTTAREPGLSRPVPAVTAAHGRTEASPAPSGKPGQWTYQESHDVTAAVEPVIYEPGKRVLRGAVYRIVQADGSVEYTNLRPASQKGHTVTMMFSYIAGCVACDLHSTIRWGSVSLNLLAYADTIRAASIEYGVDEAFLRAVIHAESAFNPRALSLKGAQGLMQLMPATASDMGVLDAFDTDQNIRGGARYLGLLLHDFNGSERLAAAAYNAGPGAVQRYSGVPPYAETQVYVERVETLRKRYGAAIHPALAARGPG
ncbi:lytic transglycosylase domain-containing protein [Rhodanobacter umsongensis]